MQKREGTYQVHHSFTREHQFLYEWPSGLRLLERNIDFYLIREGPVSLPSRIETWQSRRTKFHVRWGQSRRSSARPSNPVSRSGTRYDVERSGTTSSCVSIRSPTVDFPFFLRFGFCFFACFRGFSNATFNRSMGSSASMYLPTVLTTSQGERWCPRLTYPRERPTLQNRFHLRRGPPRLPRHGVS